MDYILEGLKTAFALLLAGDAEAFSAVWASFSSSTLAMAGSLAVGIPAGFCMGAFRFRGKEAARTIFDTLLAFPTVVIGLLVYAFINGRGPLGEFGLLFTIEGMAIGQFICALPIIVSLTATAIESLDRRLGPTLLTLGATPRQAAVTALWEARFAVLFAAVSAYGRVVSEVGIAMMVGGNIKWHTRTITTAIALETGKGEFAQGLALGMILLLMAFLVNLSLAALKRRGAPS